MKITIGGYRLDLHWHYRPWAFWDWCYRPHTFDRKPFRRTGVCGPFYWAISNIRVWRARIGKGEYFDWETCPPLPDDKRDTFLDGEKQEFVIRLSIPEGWMDVYETTDRGELIWNPDTGEIKTERRFGSVEFK